jgi:hypothetical protein
MMAWLYFLFKNSYLLDGWAEIFTVTMIRGLEVGSKYSGWRGNWKDYT